MALSGYGDINRSQRGLADWSPVYGYNSGFKNRGSVDAIEKGKFTLGADASIAAGPVGRHVEASTDIKFKSEIYSYSRSRGLFAGLAIEGAALLIDQDATWALYSRPAYDILHKTELKKIPLAAKQFRQIVLKYVQ